MSNLEMLTRIPTSMIQWISSWLNGRRKIEIITVSTVTSNINIFSSFPLSGWHACEGGSSCTLEFDSTHGGKTWGTHFTHMWMSQRPDFNHVCEVILPHDLTTQSPEGPVFGLELGIGPRIGAINCALELFCMHTRAKCFATNVLRPPPLSAHCESAIIQYGPETA